MMIFRRNSLRKILKEAKKKRRSAISDDLDNVLFLDFDGVINIDVNNYGRKPFDPSCMENINRLCKTYDLRIVVISSWKKYPNYQKLLYDSGLDRSVTVLGKTETVNGPREEEIKKYLADHIYIDRFIILDDGVFDELTPYHVRTRFTEGFSDQKYEEAAQLLKSRNQ